MNNQVDFEGVLRWVMENQNDTEAMDAINRLSYSFTQKYRAKGMKNERLDTTTQKDLA